MPSVIPRKNPDVVCVSTRRSQALSHVGANEHGGAADSPIRQGRGHSRPPRGGLGISAHEFHWTDELGRDAANRGTGLGRPTRAQAVWGLAAADPLLALHSGGRASASGLLNQLAGGARSRWAPNPAVPPATNGTGSARGPNPPKVRATWSPAAVVHLRARTHRARHDDGEQQFSATFRWNRQC